MTKEKFSVDLLKPHQKYINKAGETVPGVTTILGILAKPALIAWANRMGLKGVDTTKFVQRQADIGTVAHARIEAELRGMELDVSNLLPEAVAKSMNSFQRFMEWWKSQEFEVVSNELQMVSEAWQVGGTADIVARRGPTMCLIDIKTGSGIFREMRMQASAYARMYRETTGTQIDDVWIARVGKDAEDDIETQEVRVIQRKLCCEAFGRLVDAYRALDKVR